MHAGHAEPEEWSAMDSGHSEEIWVKKHIGRV